MARIWLRDFATLSPSVPSVGINLSGCDDPALGSKVLGAPNNGIGIIQRRGSWTASSQLSPAGPERKLPPRSDTRSRRRSMPYPEESGEDSHGSWRGDVLVIVSRTVSLSAERVIRACAVSEVACLAIFVPPSLTTRTIVFSTLVDTFMPGCTSTVTCVPSTASF